MDNQNPQAIDREVIEPFDGTPRHKPRGRPGRPKGSTNRASEAVTVDQAKSAPKGRAKPIGKATVKEIEALTVTGFDVAQWVMPYVSTRPVIDLNGHPIWPIDRKDPEDVENLQVFCENTAKLINRMPDKWRRWLVTSLSGGTIGAEITGAIKGIYGLIGGRIMLQMVAAMMAKQPAEPTDSNWFTNQAAD